MVRIRPAVASDLALLGRVHVRTWQAAYRGEMPDAYLDGLRAEDRAAMWGRLLDQGDAAPARLIVAEGAAGAVLGFACYGPSDDEGVGELSAMNIDPDHWRDGVGSALLAEVVADLVAQGFGEAILWTGVVNERAQRFYAKHGWKPDGQTKSEDVLGVVVDEMRMSRLL